MHDYLVWIGDKIADHFLGWIVSAASIGILTKIQPWLRRSWQRFSGLFRKNGTVGTNNAVAKTPILDAIGTWCLLLAIVLLALWNRKIERETRLLRVEMVRYVLPRELTKEQIDVFGKYLSSHTQPHEVAIKYILGDQESQRYAENFASAFRSGNWLPDMMPVDPAAIICQANLPGNIPAFTCSSGLQQMINRLGGIDIEQTGPNPPPPSTLQEKLHPAPFVRDLVFQALQAAGIQGIGASYSHSNDPLDTITVFVGLRKRDNRAILPPKFYERANLPAHISDDDF